MNQYFNNKKIFKWKNNNIDRFEYLFENFNYNKKIFKSTKDYIFNYTIQTDGIGCSLLFKHISIKDKKYGGYL